jgi:hypothetical protein
MKENSSISELELVATNVTFPIGSTCGSERDAASFPFEECDRLGVLPVNPAGVAGNASMVRMTMKMPVQTALT